MKKIILVIFILLGLYATACSTGNPQVLTNPNASEYRIKIHQCYHTFGIALYEIIQLKDGTLMGQGLSNKEVGCRCEVTVNGHPFISIRPMDKKICKDIPIKKIKTKVKKKSVEL